MHAHAADIEYVSEERIGSEVRRMLGAPRPSRAIRLMDDTGTLASTLPELAALAREKPDEPVGSARFDAGLAALDRATAEVPGNERVALAALFRPLGPGRARLALNGLRVSARDSEAIGTLIAALPEVYRRSWSDGDVRRYMNRVRDELLDDLLVLRRAWPENDPVAQDLEAELAARVAEQRAAASPLTLSELAVDGRDLRETLGIPESPAIGLILERLLADVVDDPTLNIRMTLLTRASLMLDELVQQGRGAADKPAIG
jgi:tRNA nucleotidyltransferase/poly(A) polymerase